MTKRPARSSVSRSAKKASRKTTRRVGATYQARKPRPAGTPKSKPIEQYEHKHNQRANNPPVGLVTPETDVDVGRKTYAYDPHLDPQLVWAGKAEHMSFEVPTVSLHVHERIDPRTIIEAVRRRSPDGRSIREAHAAYEQLSLFGTPTENPPLREAVEFYKHKHGWSNRLIAGDSLLVMNSLIEKEGLAGQVQMIYIDPPYGIKYGSNFQPFVNKRDVKDGKDDDLNQEPEMIKAFRDTWELGIHSYLGYLRDRLFLARELLDETGSVFVQISDENVHRARSVMDDVFRGENFCSLITFRKKTMPLGSTYFEPVADYLLWYAKDKRKTKTRPLFRKMETQGDSNYKWIELADGTRRRMSRDEIDNHRLLPAKSRVYRLVSMLPAQYRKNQDFEFEFEGVRYPPPKNLCWKTTLAGMERLRDAGRLQAEGATLQYVLFEDDYPVSRITALWDDTAGPTDKRFVVQTSTTVVARCILATTDPGDLVFDPTCGSGTAAYVAEQWGRRWITCDTSRVAVTLAKQRLMTTLFDYYELAHPEEGVDSGFKYETAAHIQLEQITNNEPSTPETLYDKPLPNHSRARVSGPFTVEAVPAPTVKPISELEAEPANDVSVARSGETQRQAQWRDELFRTGIRAKGGKKIEFTRVEPLPGTRWLHADAETREASPQRAVISFGSEFSPLEQRQVELAIEEAQTLVPKPRLVVFATFQFDPEAAKDIDETAWPGVTLLKAQMNTDLLTEDLKKKRSSNESFWLIGQPDVTLERVKSGADKGLYRVEVHGFDYYNPKTGSIESGGRDQIAMWMLDPDYDGRSLFPRQVFFPMAGDKEGWARLAKNLRAEIDEDLIEQYRGNVSLPFKAGDHKRAAVKIVDDRGIESLKIIEVD